MGLADHHVPEFEPVADEAATVTTERLRVTVLTSRLLRIEHAPDGEFEDRPSQTVWYRDQPVPRFEVTETGTHLAIETDHLHLRYDRGEPPSSESLSITLVHEHETYHYGDDDGTLGGTTRTLDGIDGAADLGDGLLSRDGWTVVDDTDALVFGDDGWLTPREADDGYEDFYFLGYGHDYLGALSEFTEITGDVPMVPRWALGNWWSRYWEYSQSELREVMEQFREEELPLTVCVVDMDWHVVDNPYHNGWTGWTWNEALFPDPSGFVDWLHDQGLRTTLNLHPAEGVYPHEAQYEAMAEHMGINPTTQQPVEFDASDPDFLRGYFEHLIQPMEAEEGIDFWWIDWQQWDESPEMAGLDPLWALNHLHALDRTRDGRRPFILSRWSGLGGHRYPVGFSGDTVISWESLAFQPYMTATGGNAQCGYWSHDVGGHFGGTGDPDAFGELYARWTQFGALSPINRIHTSKMPFVDKRPWTFGDEVAGAVGDAMRRRHALVPYLYTMAWRAHDRGVPMVRPSYYHHPEADAAYHVPQQYYLGSELLAAPHVRPAEETTNLSRRSVWLPEGTWFDVDSGDRYEDGIHARYGDLADVPLYAKAGAIVPMDADPAFGDVDPPDHLRVLAFPGADGEFDLYEDDGVSRDSTAAVTPLAQHWEGDWLALELGPVRGDTDHVPDSRAVEWAVRGVHEDVTVDVEGASDHAVDYDPETRTLSVVVPDVEPDDDLTVYLDTGAGTLLAPDGRVDERLEEMLRYFEMPAGAKPPLLRRATGALEGESADLRWLGDFAAVLTTAQIRAVAETVAGAGVERISHADGDRILLWNDDSRADVTYQFARYDQWGVPINRAGDSEHGTVPGYRVIELDEFETADWRLTVDYADVARVSYEGTGHDPTQE